MSRDFGWVPELSNYAYGSLNSGKCFISSPKRAMQASEADVACHMAPRWQIFAKIPCIFLSSPICSFSQSLSNLSSLVRAKHPPRWSMPAAPRLAHGRRRAKPVATDCTSRSTLMAVSARWAAAAPCSGGSRARARPCLGATPGAPERVEAPVGFEQ